MRLISDNIMNVKRMLLSFLLTLLTGISLAGNTEVQITHFSEKDGLPQSVFTGIIQDSKGYIWICSWNGLCRYDGYSFFHYKARQGDNCPLPNNRILSISETKDGNILCKFHENKFFLFKFNEKRFVALPDRVKSQADRFRPTAQQKSMIGCLPEYKDIETRILYKDRQGGYWVFTHSGLDRVVFNKKRLSPVKRSSEGEEFIRCIFQYGADDIFVADKNGVICVWDKVGNTKGYLCGDGSISKLRHPFGANAYCMFRDSHGYLWIGTKPNGLFRLMPLKDGGFKVKAFFKGKDNKYGINNNSVYSVLEDKFGRILVGTYGGGLNVIINPWSETPQFIHCDNGLDRYPVEAKFIHDMLLVPDGSLLLATHDGLFATKIQRGIHGLRFLQNKRVPSDVESLGNNQVMSLLRSKDGKIYVATYGGGLNVVSSGNLFSDKIRFRAYTMDNGMSTDIVLALYEDKKGLIWAVSEHGLMSFNPRNDTFTNYIEGTFTKGFSFSECPPLGINTGKTILFGTTQGVLAVDENVLGKSRYVPKIVFDMPDSISLSPEEKSLNVSFAAIDYNKTEPIQYAYMLEDVDKKWLYTKDTHINLSNIPAGTFRLRVRSTNGDGVWVDNEACIIIHRTPYFNERPVAWMLYGGLVLAFIFLLVKVICYIRSLEKEIRILRLSKEEKMEYIKARLGDMIEGDAQSALPVAIDGSVYGVGSVSSSDGTGSYNAFKEKVETFMQKHYSDSELNVGMFSCEMGLSRSLLYIQMKKVYGCTPNIYMQNYRLEKAYGMLINDKGLNVSEIAYRCGFTDPKYFSRCFKKAEGCTPTEFRERHQLTE